MPIVLTWPEIATRLLCALVAGGLVGLNRSEHGRAAGIRTAMLVCLAACVAMLQVNLLLSLAGRPSDSFIMNDLMRLPLGILSGMGFIGAGAIVRRDNFVVGVTTAATMWFLTVLGLCFGGGQIALGATGAVLAIVILTGIKYLEDRMKQDHQGRLLVVTDGSGPEEEQILSLVRAEGFRASAFGYSAGETEWQEWTCELRWHATLQDVTIPAFVRLLRTTRGVTRISWTPQTR